MFVIIGIVTVLGAIALGYMMEHGNFAVLWQPAEFVIIYGAAIGSLVVASPKEVLGAVVKGVLSVLGPTKASKAFYMDMLIMLSMLFMKIRREGLVAIEKDIEAPESSQIFAGFLRDKSNTFIVDFVCDTMRVFSTVNIEQHEFDNIMEADIDAFAHEGGVVPASINRVGDALPGLGIVAAVLGVVLTMQNISAPPDVLGHSIGAALLGTFLGVLLCYGLVGPMATKIENLAQEREAYFNVIRTTLAGAAHGATPMIALEFGRRSVPDVFRPSFEELEGLIRR